ncbi:MAG TPA: cell division protein FtsQ/DivIB, partial [Burkholderiaceae bacterium]|nr:cell division protein FtsQ/DivIB [Burkholderiaceae bacterium]
SSAQMLKMVGRLQPEFAAMDARIDTLELSGRGSWRVELDSGAEVELGRGSDDEVIARTKSFIATLPELRNRYAQHPLLYADLRHNDGYAVRLKGISTSADAAKKN